MNQLAKELNDALDGCVVGKLLSDFGRRMYFPNGIIAQSAEAGEKAKNFNATIGMATNNGKPIILSPIQAEFPNLSPAEAVAYAPTAGVMALRKAWQEAMLRKNPSLNALSMSLPAVVPGLTPGVCFSLELFLDRDQALVCPDMFWENYRLIVEDRLGSSLALFNTFTDAGGFDCQAFERALKANVYKGRVCFILNFPNNPSGYSPTKAEAKEILRILVDLANQGIAVCAICDDAYYGLFYEDDVERESLFAKLAGASANILAVKLDGPTKEDFVWGFRSGFLTFGSKDLGPAHYEALQKKLMGTIRSSASSSSMPSQSVLLKAMRAEGYEEEKADKRALMLARYRAARAALAKLSSPRLKVMPFNSGYFMCFKTVGIDAEKLRQRLIAEYGVGTIALDASCLRVAFSSVETEKLEELYTDIYKAADSL